MTDPDLLALPAADAVRAYARKLLIQAGGAHGRMAAGDDGEALHDFRVALRRLRSHLRAYEGCHGVGRACIRHIRAAAEATGGGRDAEVALLWLERACAALNGARTAGAQGLMEGLRARRDRAYAHTGRDADGRWDELVAELRHRLAREPEGEPAGTPFRAAAARVISAHVDKLRERLSRVHTVADQGAAHRVRIATKQLRYLIEPLRGEVADAKPAVSALADFQDTLGIMHDMQVMIDHLRDALHDAAVRHADHMLDLASSDDPGAVHVRLGDASDPRQAGLLALANLAARERDAEFARVEKSALSDQGAALLAPVDRVVAALAEAPGAAPDG